MQSKKKILIFSTAYIPFIGGAEVAIKEITDRLRKRATDSFEFDLITAKLDKNLPSVEVLGAVTVYRVGSGSVLLDKLLLPFRGAWLAFQLTKKVHYQCFWAVMVTFGAGAGYVCNIFRQLSFKKKIPIILTLQEGDSENYLQYKWGGLISLSWRLALWKTDYLTAISTFLLHRAEKYGYKGKSRVVPNGVDVPLFSKKIPHKTGLKIQKMLGKNPSDIFLVTVSRLVHKNATDDIIRALVLLPPYISLIVIGKGEEGPALQTLARDLGVSHRVKFLGFISYENIPQYLAICDIFVRPSRSEGFGNSFIEAMTIGLPVIATPVGGIPDFLDDGKTGVFCSPDNPKSLAQAVLLLLGNHSLARNIVFAARERVRERYDWNIIAREMETCILDLKSSV